MALCEGPVEEVLRIWADSNLIYDKHNPDNDEIVSVGFSQQSDGGGGKSGFGMNKKKGGQGGDSPRFSYRFYNGSESQLQDPFMVEKQGSDLVPAHRGLCYLFFEHFALADFGNRTPTITAEVAVKKQMGISYRILENLPGSDGLNATNDNYGAHVVDPERYRLYTTEVDATTHDHVIRVFDMSTNTEIRRVSFTEINEINADQPGIYKYLVFGVVLGPYAWAMSDFLGLAGNGDLVVKLTTGAQSFPIAFLDPNTFTVKHQFGRASIPFENTDTDITNALSCTPIAYIEVAVSLTGQVETTPKRATCVQSWGGNFYIFGQDHEQLSYFRVSQSLFAQVHEIQQGPPEVNGGKFYFGTESGTGSFANVIEVAWTVGGAASFSGAVGGSDTFGSTAGVKVLREITAGGGISSYFVGIESVQYLYGAERVIWFETYKHPDPAIQGTYAVA
jgi:hypothetical protein